MGEEKVKVRSKLTVVPSKAVAPGRVYPLSNLDYMMQLHNVRLIYYFKKLSDEESSDLVMALKMSLSAVLSSYPVVCGRLHSRDDGNWEIKCSDAGVRVLEASVDMTLDNWLQTADRCSELKLCYWENIASDPSISSLLYIQLNVFEGGGMAVGLSCSHMLADPSCATLFMKAWGETHRRAQVLHPPFFHPPGLKPRPNVRKETIATSYYDSTFKGQTPTPTPTQTLSQSNVCDVYKTAILKFSHEMVEQCISEVQSGIHNYQGVTAFEALSALFWGACTRADPQLQDGLGDANLCVCTEFRKIIIAPLPHGFFGNALHFSEVRMGAQHVSNWDLSYAAKAIHDDVGRLEREELRSVIEWMESDKDKVGRLPPPFYLYAPNLTAVNGEGFFTYDCVFDKEEKEKEKEKAVHVSYYVEPVHGEGLFFVLPSAEGNSSRTVMLTLPAHHLTQVYEDPSILRFSPTLWMK